MVESVYDVIPADQGWLLVRKRGGYREAFATRAEALERGSRICRQLAPARVRVMDRRGEVAEEVVYSIAEHTTLAGR